MTNFNPNLDAITGDANITARLLIMYLRQYADFKRITHTDLAAAAGMKRSSVSRLLSGRFDPRLRTFLKIAGALNLHLELAPEISKRNNRLNYRFHADDGSSHSD